MFWKRIRKISLSIDKDKCSACGICVRMCHKGALRLKNERGKQFAYLAFPYKCTECGKCLVMCKERAIDIDSTGWGMEKALR